MMLSVHALLKGTKIDGCAVLAVQHRAVTGGRVILDSGVALLGGFWESDVTKPQDIQTLHLSKGPTSHAL